MKRSDLKTQRDDFIDEEKALEIIRSLLVSGSGYMKRRANAIVDKVGDVLDKPFYRKEIALFLELADISQRLTLIEYEKLLESRSVVGVGGQFSAGKSCFLNTILGANYLPDALSPSTSIATYIVNGENLSLYAYTHQGRRLPLDMEHINHLTHKMTRTFNFNPSTAILSLGLEAPSLPLKHVALLDTPGYTKPEGDNIDASDRLKAFDLLKVVDFLIWLADADNGELTQGDIKFIKSLGVKENILFVVNKADKKQDIHPIIEKIWQTVDRAHLPVAGVVPYSSHEPGKYPQGVSMVWDYLHHCNDMGRNVKGLTDRISEKMQKIINEIGEHQKESSNMKERIKNVILDTVVPGNCFLPYYYFETIRHMNSAKEDKNAVIKVKRSFDRQFSDVGGAKHE